MRRHHVVNDALAGEPLVVTFCARCFSGVGFDATVDGSTHTFDVFGAYLGTFVMSDRETGTVWSRYTGEALAGPLASRRLQQVPVHMTSLEVWLDQYPESLAPDPAVMVEPEPVRPGKILGRMRATLPSVDARLPPATLILGVAAGGEARAYVMDPVARDRRLHLDTLGGIPIVLLGPRGTWSLTYDRRVTGRVVELRVEGDEVVDESGAKWSDTGRALDGPQPGAALPFVPSLVTEWCAWAAHYPETDIVVLA